MNNSRYLRFMIKRMNKLIKSGIYLLVIFFLSSCSSTVVFKQSELVPAATGTVKVKELDNGNYSIVVKVAHLASPDRLKKSRDYYIVWNEAKEGEFNLGVMELDEELNGSLTTESTYKPKRIIISAEKDEKETKMSKHVVLETKKL